LYGAEGYGIVMLVMHVVMTWDTRSLERWLGLSGKQTIADADFARPGAVTVDVFIPTYHESVGLLHKTVLAARELRLPHTSVQPLARRDRARARLAGRDQPPAARRVKERVAARWRPSSA
jgi:hypothetical protein